MTDVSAGSGLTLEILASDIKARIAAGDRDLSRSNNHYQGAGRGLIEAKSRVMAEELPGTTWLLWSAEHFPQIGERRIEQLISIGRGLSTQDAINEAERNRYADMSARMDEVLRRTDAVLRPEGDTAQTYAVSPERTPRRDRDFAARRDRRAEARSIREANGATITPLAPIEHRKALKEGRDILARLDLDRLKTAVAFLRPTMMGPRPLEADATPEQYRFAYFNRANDAMRFAFWPDGAPKPDQEMVAWAQNVIEIWTELSGKLAAALQSAPVVEVVSGITPAPVVEVEPTPAHDERPQAELIHAALDSIAAAMTGETINGDADIVRTDGSRFARVGTHFGDAYIKLNIERDDDDDDTDTLSSLVGLKLRQVIIGAVGALRFAMTAGTLAVDGDSYRDHFGGERRLMASAPFEDEAAWIDITSPARDFTPYSRTLKLNRTPKPPITPAQPVPEPDVEVVAAVEPVPEPGAKCTVTGCDGGRLYEPDDDGVRTDLGPCGVCHPEASAEAVEVSAPVVRAKVSKAEPTIVKPAPKNKRSNIGAVTRPDPATYAKIAAEALARAA
jgi:hypothetical protein